MRRSGVDRDDGTRGGVMMDATLDFDPLRRAESMMAKVNKMPVESDAFAVVVQQREQVRDLLLLSIAKSLDELASRSRP